MSGRYSEYLDDLEIEEEPNGIFSSLQTCDPVCQECGYDGPLVSKKRGYTCPECHTLLLPLEL